MINSLKLKIDEFAKLFDNTLLAATAERAEFERLCKVSAEYGFAMVAVNSSNISLCRELLKGTGVRTGSSVSFPLGQCSLKTKLNETANAIEDGAEEIDYVINIGRLKDKDYGYMEKEMSEILSICRPSGVLCKVIFENCYLTKDEIKTMCSIALNVGPDFVKTSTGFGKGGATEEDVKLMKSCVGQGIGVKASGGIRTLETALAMYNAGATRIGTSAGVSIINELKQAVLDKQIFIEEAGT